MNKVIIFSYMGIGDNLMFFRALSYFDLSNCKIYWITKEENRNIINHFFSSDKSLLFTLKGKRGFRDVVTSFTSVIKFLSNSNATTALILDYKAKPVLFFYLLYKLSLIRQVFVSTQPNLLMRILFPKNIPLSRFLNLHEVDRYKILLENILKKNSDNQSLPLKNSKKYILNENIIMVPGSARTFKQWKIENFVTIIKKLLENNFTVIILGGSEDKKIGDEILKKISSPNLINKINQTSLVESANIINSSMLVVSNDSAMMHLADLLNTRVIGLFGITRPERCGPYTQLKNCICSTSDEAGTYFFGPFLPWDATCINQINVSQVELKIEETINEYKQQ